MIGKTYEALIEKGRRKEIGAFYTPTVIIDYMLGKTLAQADLLANPFLRVLDPACGCGYFLVRAYELLHKMFSEKLGRLRRRYGIEVYLCTGDNQKQYLSGEEYWQPENLPYHIISHCLYGADIDEQAVAIAAEALVSKAGTCLAIPNVVVADSLAKAENSVSNGLNTGPKLWTQTYDYIIGNPPYVSYGLRGVKAIESGRYEALAAAYPNSAEYKLSLYALFFERGVELLAEGGKLAYITPDSFLSGRYFSKLRNFLNQYAINSITLLEFTVFPDAAIGKGVITVLTKRPSQGNELCVEAAVAPSQLETAKLAKRFMYKQQYLESRFSLFLNKQEFEVFHAMQVFDKRFADCCSLYSGCIGRYGQKSIISCEPVSRHVIHDYQGNAILDDWQAQSRWKKLIGRGAYIQQYFIKSASQYIYIHEDEGVRRTYAKSGFDLEKYAKEKLFIRQTGESLIAAYDNSGSFCLNNLHILYGKDASFPLKLLLALINSRLYNYYYQCLTRETGRVLPQVDIDTIRRMPVITVLDRQIIVELVDELLACHSQAEDWRVLTRSSRVQEIRHTLEAEILAAVDIRRSTKKAILDYEKSSAMLFR